MSRPKDSTTDCGEDRINTQNDNIEEEWDEGPSKSEIKREMLALQKLGERLTSLSPSYLARMTLSEDMLSALEEAKRIKSHNALRRHYRRLGKLLQHEDLESIQQVIDELDQKHHSSVARFQSLERWRDRLIEGDSEVFGEFLAEYQNADRQHLRHLIHAVKREQERGGPPQAYRKLFKYLREVSGI
ncbi:MAG: ribosome biogenesis factor YjgA [Candidatus Thiodiazotropha sp. 4PDIV1]